MATINKKMVRPKRVEWKKTTGDNTNYYASPAWQRLRNTYIKEHPICECCLEHNKITEATSVHHMRPFMTEKTEEARWNTFLNPNNLIAVCNCCHNGFHYKLRHNRLLEAKELTEEEWKQAQSMYNYESYIIENE